MEMDRQISDVLERMAEILDSAAMTDWASSLRRHLGDLSDDFCETKIRVRAMYGGMGSLNDVVIYEDGVAAVKINVEFDELRTRLYELCAA